MANENVEIARRAYAAYNRSGIEGILGYLDPEIEWWMWEEFARGSRVFNGHEGVREVLTIFNENFDDFQVDPGEFIGADDERIIVSVRLSGRAKGTGEEQTFDLFHLWTIRGGCAVRFDSYATREEALAAARAESTGPGSAK